MESRARGVAELPVVLTEHPIGGLRPPAVTTKAAGLVDVVAAALVTPPGPSAVRDATTSGQPSRLTEVHADPLSLFEWFCERGWTDGLPVLAPTEVAVESMLAAVKRDRREVVAVLPPRQGEATIERIAINAVMAGCRPEYLPLLISAIEAVADPAFNLDGVQATTHPVAPLIIVNGPVAVELGIASGYNCFGPGHRANATIGRAMRLLLMNVGGGLPGTGDRATQGSPSKYSYCIAENEAANPWGPLHVERGYHPEQSTVTVIGCEGPHNIQEHVSNTGEGILQTIAGAMGQAGSNNILRHGWPLLALGPEHAATIAEDGYRKEDVKAYVFEQARYPHARLSPEYRAELAALNAGICPDHACIMAQPEDLTVIVAGGPGKHSSWQPTFGSYTRPVTRLIPS